MITTTYANHESKAIHVRNTWAKRCDRHLFLSSRDNASLPAVRLCDTDDRAHLWCKSKPRIFCMITTTYANHESKAIHVRNTWAKRCDRHLFLSSRDNASLPAVRLCDTDDRAHLWCKTKEGMRYIYDKYLDDYDWFLKADDDSYLIMENLRHFLAPHRPHELLYFGCKLQYRDVVYMSGGAGYVLSRAAVKQFVTAGIGYFTDSSQCLAGTDTGVEDLEMGKCLQHIGVTADDYDWFLKADNYFPVVIKNLRHFLASHSPQELLYFGCKLQYESVKYIMGGAGYVLSRAALNKFVTVGIGSKTDNSICLAGTDTGAEDLKMGSLLNNNNKRAQYKRANHVKQHNKTSGIQSKPRIFCMITTTYANHESKAIHVRNTWAKRCDRHLFLSSRD
ncbi:unnamed protein product, partial [Medioppia subpectinata]